MWWMVVAGPIVARLIGWLVLDNRLDIPRLRYEGWIQLVAALAIAGVWLASMICVMEATELSIPLRATLLGFGWLFTAQLENWR